MKRLTNICVTAGALAVTGAIAVSGVGSTVLAQGRGSAPSYRVDPLWPQPLQNHWVWGSITGIAIDGQDHLWVVHRGADSLEGNEKGMMLTPPTSSICCQAAPFIVQLDQQGKVVSTFGGPGQGYDWPQSPGGIAADSKGNVWITGAGLVPAPPSEGGRGGRGGAPGAGRGGAPAPADAHVLKFSKDGKFVLQIGKPGQTTGDDALNKPAAVAVDAAANEVFVADTGNRRIAVFDSETGKFKRAWGAYGEKPGADPGAYDPNGAPARQFRDVTCVHISKDNQVYVCDRTSNRIQVFSKDGKFVKEGIVNKSTLGSVVTGQFGVVSSFGSAWDLAFSNDAQQRYVFVANGQDKRIDVLQRDNLSHLGTIGEGGRQAGRFLVVSTVAVDSRGNLYTGEQHHGKRVQKFVPAR